jgi:hypothetical protein
VKRCIGFLVLSLVGLLLAGAMTFVPAPIAAHTSQSMAGTDEQPAAATRETGESPDFRACPPNAGHSRISQPSLHGIAAQFVPSVVLESQPSDTEVFFTCFAQELGFDQFLRAPPLNS